MKRIEIFLLEILNRFATGRVVFVLLPCWVDKPYSFTYFLTRQKQQVIINHKLSFFWVREFG